MTTPALKWISDAHKGGYLRAAFIDCQIGEYEDIEDKSAFGRANKLAEGLREKQVPIYHFAYDYNDTDSLEPFYYSEKKNKRLLDHSGDFKIVIPRQDELIYPKRRQNGFTNPYSKMIINNGDRNPSADYQSVLICAGFQANICLQETCVGSFKAASNPEKHKVIVAINATDLEGEEPDEYMAQLKMFAPQRHIEQVEHATVEEIIATLRLASSTSQSSQLRPCRVLRPRG